MDIAAVFLLSGILLSTVMCLANCECECAHMCPFMRLTKPPLKRGKGGSHFLIRETKKGSVAVSSGLLFVCECECV